MADLRGAEIMTHGGRIIALHGKYYARKPPVVYFHGTPESRLTIDTAPAALCKDLFSFDRPGYGGSSFAPFDFASISADVREIMDRLAIPEVRLIGHSGGAPFALACAAYLGARVLAVAVTSGPGDYTKVPGAFESLTPTDQQAAALSQSDPQRAAELFAQDFRFMREDLLGESKAVSEYLAAQLPNDPLVTGDPELLESFATSCTEGVREGVDGCAWDNVCWVPEWSFPLQDIHCPVHLYYGARDGLMPQRYGEWLESQIPSATLTIWPEDGHLGLLRHWDDVIANLRSVGH